MPITLENTDAEVEGVFLDAVLDRISRAQQVEDWIELDTVADIEIDDWKLEDFDDA